jgi:hypothetical protein
MFNTVFGNATATNIEARYREFLDLTWSSAADVDSAG